MFIKITLAAFGWSTYVCLLLQWSVRSSCLKWIFTYVFIYLQLLLLFLCKVLSKEKKNKMNLNNIAMIMAPNLFMSGGKPHTDIKEVKKAQRTVNIVRMLIKYHTILWTVCRAPSNNLYHLDKLLKCNFGGCTSLEERILQFQRLHQSQQCYENSLSCDFDQILSYGTDHYDTDLWMNILMT